MSWLLLTKVPGHVVGRVARMLDILWLISRGPIFVFFPEKRVTSITTEFVDKKEELNSSSHIFSNCIHLSEPLFGLLLRLTYKVKCVVNKFHFHKVDAIVFCVSSHLYS